MYIFRNTILYNHAEISGASGARFDEYQSVPDIKTLYLPFILVLLETSWKDIYL
jgi:hypothetical protein